MIVIIDNTGNREKICWTRTKNLCTCAPYVGVRLRCRSRCSIECLSPTSYTVASIYEDPLPIEVNAITVPSPQTCANRESDGSEMRFFLRKARCFGNSFKLDPIIPWAPIFCSRNSFGRLIEENKLSIKIKYLILLVLPCTFRNNSSLNCAATTDAWERTIT